MTVVELSKRLWKAMHDENIEFLKNNIYSNAVFVHMGVTLKRDDEIDVIKNKQIVYKVIEFEEVIENKFGTITVLLTKLKLTAIVGGNEVVNPFVVTEVYSEEEMKLISLSYTRVNY